ncbi:putative PIF1 DNA helicase/replication protein A1-like protein [Tanacetum coccineum]
MLQNYLDAMAMIKNFGYPDLFITFTCNPKWPEITRFLRRKGVKSEDRPDITTRVSKMKLDQLIKDIKEKRIFRRVKAAANLTCSFKKGKLSQEKSRLIMWSHGSSVHRYGLYAIQWIMEVNGKPTPNLEAFVNVTNVRLLNVLCSVVFIFNIETLIFLSWGTQEIKDGEFVSVKTVHFNGKPKLISIAVAVWFRNPYFRVSFFFLVLLIAGSGGVFLFVCGFESMDTIGVKTRSVAAKGSNIHDVNSGVKPLKSILKKPKVTNVANGSGADVSTTKVSRKVSVDERLDVHVYSVQNIPAGEAQEVGSQNVKIHKEGPNIYLTAGINVENATAFAACNEGQHSCVVAGDETTGNIGKPDLMSSKASDGSNVDEVNVDANGNIDKGSDAGNNATKNPMSFANAINSEQVSKKLNFRTLVNEERVVDSDTRDGNKTRRKIPESPWGSPIPIGDGYGDVNRFPDGDGDGDGDEAEKRGWGWSSAVAVMITERQRPNIAEREDNLPYGQETGQSTSGALSGLEWTNTASNKQYNHTSSQITAPAWSSMP